MHKRQIDIVIIVPYFESSHSNSFIYNPQSSITYSVSVRTSNSSLSQFPGPENGFTSFNSTSSYGNHRSPSQTFRRRISYHSKSCGAKIRSKNQSDFRNKFSRLQERQDFVRRGTAGNPRGRQKHDRETTVDRGEFGSPETKFVDLGADSLDTVEIMMALEEKFGVSVGEGGAENIATVQDAADLIEKVKAAAT